MILHPTINVFELFLNTCYSLVLKPALLNWRLRRTRDTCIQIFSYTAYSSSCYALSGMQTALTQPYVIA